MNSTCELGRRGASALKPYPAYRDSDVEWLGEVPAHWEIRRLGRLGRLFKGGGGTKEDEREDGIPCVRYGDLYTHHRSFITESRACVTPELAATTYTPIRYGDVLFAGSGETIDEIGKSAVNLIRGAACCGGDVIIFRPSIDADARFLGYATDCSPSACQKACIGRGFTVMHIYSNDLKYMAVAIPPLAEQAVIVHFLDHADRRIRRYIRAKEKLIALLEEQKRAVIHQVVTGQIDVRTGEPYGEYKASGVEWLDKVPTHWEVKKLHQCGTIIGGMTPSMENRRFWDGSIPWVTPKDMKRDVIDDSGMKVTEGALHETSLRLIDPPAVLMVVRGMILARRVPIAWIKSPVTINQDMKALLPGAGINAEFLARMLDSAQEAFVPLIDQAGHGTCRLPTERWRSLAVAIPPADEQRLIVDSLEASTRTIVASIENAHRQTTLLGEYRTRLIADVVTGKLDVRGVAAGLPEPDAPADDDTPDGIRAASGLDTRAEELATGGVDVRHGEVEVRGAADAATVAWWGAEEAVAGDRR